MTSSRRAARMPPWGVSVQPPKSGATGRAGLGLDETPARPDLLAHELAEDEIGLGGIVHLGAQQHPRARVHRRLPELVGVHLAPALEALDGEVLAVLL